EHKVEVNAEVSVLQPGQTTNAVPGEVVLYTAMEQVEGAAGQSLEEAGWQLATFRYDTSEITVESIQNLVESYDEAEAFENDQAVRALDVHLTSMRVFEQQEDVE